VTATATVADAPTYRALMVTPQFTAIDGCYEAPTRSVRLTPEDTWAQGLGALLTRVARTMPGSGVLLLDRVAARHLRLPVGPEDPASQGLDDARAAGWLHGTVGAWTTFYAEDRPTVTVAVTSWPGIDRSPLIHVAASLDSVYRLSMWHRLTGTAWSGTPGVAGLKVFRSHAPTYPMAGGKKGKPTFRHPDDQPWIGEAYELDFDIDDWARPLTLPYAHGWDASRMYLAAANSCESLAVWSLKHTGRKPFDPTRAGWWKVELGPWNDDRIPAPAGPGGPGPRWVTTPTLALLADLEHKGELAQQSFEVLDSWTAPGKRILRPWAETLEQTYQTARGMAEAKGDPFGKDQDAEAVQRAVKGAYREAIGLLNRPGSAVYRPDWHYAVIAQARSNLWRRMWATGQAENRWPIEVKTDCVWYASESQEPAADKPAGIPVRNPRGLTDALGTFKFAGTRERRGDR
jgi:hypothetical protein